jgi:RND family efflux transporter MFP subunit
MDTSALIAKLHIAQTQAQQLAVGGAATLTVPGIAEPVAAKVSLISPALDPGSTTVEVWLRVENAKGLLKVGTPVRASIAGRAIGNALTVPSAAVQTDADGTSKFVMAIAPDSTAHKKPITLGIQSADDVQVLSGLATSDMVITTGAYGLDEGTKVKIGTDPGAAGAGKDADDK